MLGPPGAGKGTLNRLLSERFRFQPISTGEVIRREMADATSEFGAKARPYMDRGDYVPDALALTLFFSILKTMPTDARVALDGFPRTIPQAERFRDWIARESHRCFGCVFLEVDVDTAVSRMQHRRVCSDCRAPYHTLLRPPVVAGICDVCGGKVIPREDDDAERIARRLSGFQEQTRPLMSWLREREVCVDLDGGADPAWNLKKMSDQFQFN